VNRVDSASLSLRDIVNYEFVRIMVRILEPNEDDTTKSTIKCEFGRKAFAGLVDSLRQEYQLTKLLSSYSDAGDTDVEGNAYPIAVKGLMNPKKSDIESVSVTEFKAYLTNMSSNCHMELKPELIHSQIVNAVAQNVANRHELISGKSLRSSDRC